LAYAVKALRAESETQSWSGCFLSDFAIFLKFFKTFFAFSNSQKVRARG
jgi:hypothetical protein